MPGAGACGVGVLGRRLVREGEWKVIKYPLIWWDLMSMGKMFFWSHEKVLKLERNNDCTTF